MPLRAAPGPIIASREVRNTFAKILAQRVERQERIKRKMSDDILLDFFFSSQGRATINERNVFSDSTRYMLAFQGVQDTLNYASSYVVLSLTFCFAFPSSYAFFTSPNLSHKALSTQYLDWSVWRAGRPAAACFCEEEMLSRTGSTSFRW